MFHRLIAEEPCHSEGERRQKGLRDIGKRGVSDQMLDKRDDEAWCSIRSCPALRQDMLTTTVAFRSLARIAHHERLDRKAIRRV